jgi:hypothetical protein
MKRRWRRDGLYYVTGSQRMHGFYPRGLGGHVLEWGLFRARAWTPTKTWVRTYQSLAVAKKAVEKWLDRHEASAGDRYRDVGHRLQEHK